MKVNKWYAEQKVMGNIDEVWDFFNNPSNLNKLTPDEVVFSIESISGAGKMYPGMLVQYKLRPIKWLPVGFYWVAEIRQVEDKVRFIDEQRFGPFSFWYHEHAFEVLEDGVLVKDILHYRVPLGILGKIVDWVAIRHVIKRIFSTRKEILHLYFSKL